MTDFQPFLPAPDGAAGTLSGSAAPTEGYRGELSDAVNRVLASREF
jgi:hypothetical protein